MDSLTRKRLNGFNSITDRDELLYVNAVRGEFCDTKLYEEVEVQVLLGIELCKELVVKERDNTGINFDIPDNLTFYNQGVSQRDNAHLDHRPLDDRHFRECCTDNGRQLSRIFLKGPEDMIASSHYRLEYFKDKLQIDSALAYRLGYVCKLLSLDYKTIYRILYGYTTQDGIRKHGLIGCEEEVVKLTVQKLETLNAQLEALEEEADNELQTDQGIIEYFRHYEDCKASVINSVSEYIEHEPALSQLTTILAMTEQLIKDNKLHNNGHNPFSQKRMYSGNELIPDHLKCKIKAMSIKQLNEFTKRIMSGWYDHFNSSQLKHLWYEVNTAKESKVQEIVDNSHDGLLKIFQTIINMGQRSETRAFINCYSQSIDFNGETEYFRFSDNKSLPPYEVIYACWYIYRQANNL